MPDTSSRASRSDRFDLRALYETSQLLSRSLELDFVLNSLLLTAMSKLLTTRGFVLMNDPLSDGFRVSAVKGIRDLKQGSVVHLQNLGVTRVLLDSDVPEPLRAHGMALAVPISFGKRDIGWLAVGAKATREPFLDLELEFLRSLVNMSSTAVHNSMMVEELKLANHDLDAKIQELNTLFDLSQEFNATIDRDRLVRLLSLALMGQLLVSKHLFLLRRNRTLNDEPEVYAISSKGVEADLEPDLITALCGLNELLLLGNGTAVEGAAVDGAAVTNGSEIDSDAWPGLTRRGLSLALPLKQHGETCGALCLGPKRTGQPYTPGDVEFLSALGNLTLVSIQNSFLVEEQIEKERLEEEMRLARRIQERLFPQKLPTFAGFDVAALAEPSRFVGGDYYDVVSLKNDRLLVAVADVTGKGVPASLLMANLQASLHVLLPIDVTIEEAAYHINRVICENTDYDKFITFFFGIIHRESAKMEYVNAGHNPPTLVRADGSIELLETGGLLLGVMKDVPYERGAVDLAPGDVLTLFTDGVTEAMSFDGEEYGEARLEALLKEQRGGSAREVLDAVRQDIAAFTKGITILSDDLTMVVVKRV